MAICPYRAEGPVGGPLTLTLESRAGQSKDRTEFGGPSLLHKGNIREGSTTSGVIKAAGDETGQAWETTAILWRAWMAKLPGAARWDCPMPHLPEEGAMAQPARTFLAATHG